MEENAQQDVPLVTIRCTVYNHEPYLRQCLDGFVMQQTTFPFEAIVQDHASTDGSAAIIREYAEKYPNIIKPIYETENQYSKHDGSIRRIMDAAMHPDSKYIATCEGDDYWTDPKKLQIQVSFLESHPDYFVSSHDVSVYHQDAGFDEKCGREIFKNLSYQNYNGIEYHTFTKDDYFNIWFMRTLAVVRRKEPYVDENVKMQYPIYYDYIDFYYIIKKGKCAFMKNIMATYRAHNQGVCSGSGVVKWSDVFLRNNYVLYNLEKDPRLLPKMNVMLVNLFIQLIIDGDYEKSFRILLRHYKETNKKNIVVSVSLIIKRLFEILCNKFTGNN